ncbi:bacterioferritin-associated ferredoxin [Yersinia pestis]|nr:bacterioferritin-associated ferredoxin [Yersinia pestis]
MYVCLCNAVSDKVIRKAVRQHQPHTVKQLRQLVPIGSDCGKCIRQAREILIEELANIPEMNDVANS